MAANGHSGNGRRRSPMDLPPLERDCMLALWPLGEGTVRQIRDEMAETRPRAYTTIMTIMDRLAKKGVVTRHKVGRGYVYKPNFSAADLRAHAVSRLVDHFFDGSNEALLEHLGNEPRPARRPAPAPRRVEPAAKPPEPAEEAQEAETTLANANESPAPTRLDDILL